MDMFQKIVAWNAKRGLLESEHFSHENEMSFIFEELLESTGVYESKEARIKAQEMVASLPKKENISREKIIDAFADIIVFATGAIAKGGYDPSKVMDEVFREIDSRKGSIVNGKFIKDNDAERYYADFSDCKRK